MPDTNDPREDLHDAQQWAEEEAFFAEVHRMTQAAHQDEAPSLAQVCYAAYAQALALPWTHAYADLPPGMRRAWEAVAAAMEAHLKQPPAHPSALEYLRRWQPQPLHDLEEDHDA